MDKQEEIRRRIKEVFKKGPVDDVILDLSKMAMNTIPVIPTNVKILNLSFNKLTNIPQENELHHPQFSKSLTDLFIDNNAITNLPELPQNLEFLSCNNNKLKVLPKLPDTLTFLDCTYNNLDKIPEVPKNCILIFYPQEKNILDIPYESENAIIPDKILLGNSIVDFDNEASYGRYYKKKTFDKLDTNPFNPGIKLGSIKPPQKYIARPTLKKAKVGGKRLTLKNSTK